MGLVYNFIVPADLTVEPNIVPSRHGGVSYKAAGWRAMGSDGDARVAACA